VLLVWAVIACGLSNSLEYSVVESVVGG
jgi:hypothetical protein